MAMVAASTGAGRHVEVGQPLGAREAGLVDAPVPSTLGPVVDLGREHVGQVDQVRGPRAFGHFGQAFGLRRAPSAGAARGWPHRSRPMAAVWVIFVIRFPPRGRRIA